MIYKALAVTLLLVVNACSTAENDIETPVQEAVDLKARASEEQEYATIFIEEMHYAVIVQELGEDHEWAEMYRSEFEELSAMPKKGCPTPKPCGSEGGTILNCKMGQFEILENLSSFNPMGDLSIGIYNPDGEPMNAIVMSENMKCPGKKRLIHTFEEPLQGGGYFEINFYSEILDQEVAFTMPFNL